MLHAKNHARGTVLNPPGSSRIGQMFPVTACSSLVRIILQVQVMTLVCKPREVTPGLQSPMPYWLLTKWSVSQTYSLIPSVVLVGQIVPFHFLPAAMFKEPFQHLTSTEYRFLFSGELKYSQQLRIKGSICCSKLFMVKNSLHSGQQRRVCVWTTRVASGSCWIP